MPELRSSGRRPGETHIQVIVASPFTDTAGHFFDPEISWLWRAGITTGCTPTLYCPDGNVTRQEMASFLARAFELPDATLDYFTDDEASPHEADINRLAEAGITTGCGGTNYCPTGLVTREQMASFLARAFDLPITANNYFSDDEGRFHEPDINRLAEAGITTGCRTFEFCPLDPVTRGQMAAFLYRGIYLPQFFTPAATGGQPALAGPRSIGD